MINLKHNINFLIIFFLEDIRIMNFINYLLLAFSLSIMFADTDDNLNYLAQIDSDKELEVDLDDAENVVTPIDFKDEYLISINFGSTIPFGKNLKSKFTPGTNLKLDVLTPFGFTLLNKDFKVAAEINMMSCTANEDITPDSEGNQYGNYSATNIGASLVTNISVIDFSVGSGLSISSGTEMLRRDADGDGDTEYNPYDMTTAYVSAGMSYTLPLSKMFQKIDMGNINFDISNLSICLFVEGIEIMGAPAEDGTSDLINAGIAVGYPILF